MSFEEWCEDEPAKSRVQIAKRIENIKEEGHFGDHKQVRDHVWELRWDNGRRVYYSLIPVNQVLLLLGEIKMAKLKTSGRRKKFITSGSMTKFKKRPREYNPTKDLLDEKLLAKAIWECLKENNPDGVIEILEAHISAKNKSQLARKHDLPRTTIYHAFKSKNPTLHTLAKLVHATV